MPVQKEEAGRTESTQRPKLGRTRVLHVIQNLNYGGMERVLADIVRGVNKDRFEMHVLVIEYLGRFADGLDRVADLHLAAPQEPWSMLLPRVLTKQIARIAPHTVHTHSGVWYKASLAARLAGIPRVVHTEHGRRYPDPIMDRTLDTLAARRTDVVAAVSDRLRVQLQESGIVSAERIRVVPNGIDTDLFAPRRDRSGLVQELGLDPETFVIGSIGRLEPIKGYDTMIEAFARLRENGGAGREAALIIGGNGSERPRLQQLIAKHRLESRVHLLGWRDDIATLLGGFSLFTLSSRSEGTSISLLEAMSAGICPVVTDVGGNRAVLGEELSHRLVPPLDPLALASAWMNAMRDPQLGVDGERARRRVEQKFAVRSMVSMYESIYERGQ